MLDLTVVCPECKNEIKLNETLAAPLINEAKKNFELKMKEKEIEFSKKEEIVLEKEQTIKEAQANLQACVDEKVSKEVQRISQEEYKKAKTALGADLEQKSKENEELLKILTDKNQKLAESQKSQAELSRQKRELEEQKNALSLTVEQKVQEELQKVRIQTKKEVENSLAPQITELEKELLEKNQKLAESNKAQADLLRQKRQLEDEKIAMDLTIEKRVQDDLVSVRSQAIKEAEENLGLQVKEKDHTISMMEKTIDDLKRQSQQGSQQLQGEVQELALESLLSSKFPLDNILPVPKGEYGGDVAQKVIGNAGQACGTILWESKRTKNWSDDWLVKLRSDQRAAKAEISVLVSQALPKGVDSFSIIDGVWVTHPRILVPVAISLRQFLIDLNTSRIASEGQQTKTEMVYAYLTGPKFRQRVEAIVEAFTNMNEELYKERKVITKIWEKRAAQIDCVMQATVGMYGDLQGIAGKSLKEIEGLKLESLDAPAVLIESSP